MRILTLLSVLLLTIGSTFESQAQNFDEAYYKNVEYRLVGPFRGGRSAAVTGVPNKPNLFYFGATGGGVWKTTNGGRPFQKS